MRHKPNMTEAKTDLDALSMGVSGQQPRNGHGETGDLAREIMEERRNRLRKQNTKLDFEIQRHELELVDFGQIQRQVLRCNEVVKQSLFAMIRRVASQLVEMNTEEEIHECLRVALIACFNDLAYEQGRETPAD